MTSAFIVLVTAGAAAAILWVVMCFLQCLIHTAICGGCSLALIEINSVIPGELGVYMMAALMAAMALSLFAAWQGWKSGLQRVRMA